MGLKKASLQNAEARQRLRSTIIDLEALLNDGPDGIRDNYIRGLVLHRKDVSPRVVTLTSRAEKFGFYLTARRGDYEFLFTGREACQLFMLRLRENLHEKYRREVYKNLSVLGLLEAYKRWFSRRFTDPALIDVITLCTVLDYELRWKKSGIPNAYYPTAQLTPRVPFAEESTRKRQGARPAA